MCNPDRVLFFSNAITTGFEKSKTHEHIRTREYNTRITFQHPSCIQGFDAPRGATRRGAPLRCDTSSSLPPRDTCANPSPLWAPFAPKNQKICDSFVKKRDCFANFPEVPVDFTTVEWFRNTRQYGTIRAKSCEGGQGNLGGIRYKVVRWVLRGGVQSGRV